MLRKICSLLLSVLIITGSIVSVSAVEVQQNNSFSEALSDSNETSNQKSVDPITITLYENEYNMGSTVMYGGWRNGVSGGSDYTEVNLSFNRTYDTSYDIAFTASVSGEYTPANANTIGLELNVTLGASKGYSLGSGISADVPIGERYLIVYRPAYYICEVVETTYKEVYRDGYLLNRYDYDTKVCYVNVFSHWDFDVVPA